MTTNRIEVAKTGHITLHQANGATLTVDGRDANDVAAKLEQVTPAQLAALQQIAAQEGRPLGDLVNRLLGRIAAQKNVVAGNISDVKTVRIGDEIHYHYRTGPPALPKELTTRLPRVAVHHLVGREEDLADLRTRLVDHNQVVLVNGLGGIGKTTLAQAYVGAYYETYRHLAWISCLSDNIIADFANTAGLFLSLGLDRRGKEAATLFEELITKLKRIETGPNLLVIDNAGPALSRLVDSLPGPPRWHILVTSRRRLERFDLKRLDFLTELETLIRPEASQKEAVFAETLEELAAAGWVLVNPETDSYKLHRIIADIAARQHPPALADVEPLVAGLTETLSLDQTKDNPVDKFQWLPFGEAAAARLAADGSAQVALLQNNLAVVLKAFGDYQGAKRLLEKATRSAEHNFGPDHPSTAVRYSNLASVLQDLGDYQGALPLAEKALAIFQAVLPEGHPDIDTVRKNYQAIKKEAA